MPTTTMSYGAYSFSPVPLMQIAHEIVRTGDETAINELTTITLTGTIVASANLAGDSGIDQVKTNMDSLRDAFKDDCQLFLVQCGATDIVRARPRIKEPPSFTESTNNWVYTAEYTIVLEFATEVLESGSYTHNVRQVNESWELEFAEEFNQYTETIDTGQDHTPYALRLTHSLSAEGIAECQTGTGEFEGAGWQQARNWILPRLGYDSGCISSGASGIFNVSPTNLGQYNHMVTKNMDEVNGTFEATETWLLVQTGVSGLPAAGALEDFTVTSTTSRTEPVSSVRIEGTIQGLEERSYGSSPGDFSITAEKYANALSYWNTVQNRLYARCKKVADSLSLPRGLNNSALTTNVAHAKTKGSINYSYEFDNRVCFLLETGALSGSVISEIITVNDTFPHDVFAIIPVLGRSNGPILQEISTITEQRREVNVEVLVEPPTGCTLSNWNTLRNSVKSAVEDVLCGFQTELTDAYSQVFKHQDTQNWVPQQGRYTRQIGWTFQDCSGTGNTSVC